MQVYLLLTEECNLHCKMCIRGEKNHSKVSYDFLAQDRIISDLKGKEIIITGGEPSLHPEFTKIVNDLSEINGSIAVTTNGTLNYYFDKVKKDKIYFQISVDGNKYWHNKIRGDGTYETTMENIIYMDNHEFNYSIASIINRDNIEGMDELINILNGFHNLRFWKLHYEMPFGSADMSDGLSSDAWNNFIDSIIKKVHFRISATKLFPFDIYNRNKNKLNNNVKRILNCGCVSQKIYIYPDYTVYPCTCLTDFPLGNLKQNTLQEIINNKNSDIFKNYKIDKSSRCYECSYKEYCNGGCIGMSYHKYGILGMGDYRCPLVGKYE